MPSAVILTAILDEYSAVRTHLTNLQDVEHPLGNRSQRGEYDTWDVIIAEVGEGNIPAALETDRAIAHFHPDVILFVGIAGGIKDVKIGDVVVATKVYYYERAKAEENSDSARPEVLKADDFGKDLIGLAKDQHQSFSILFKPIASGETVLASSNSNKFLFVKDHYNDAIAVEMEGYGFLYAVSKNEPKVPALIIRGISDLIDGKSAADATGSQPMAAKHASELAFKILEKYKPKSEILTQPFDFDVVTVNQSGIIINRESREAEYFTEKLLGGVTLEMVKIPRGTFIMGSPTEEAESKDRERPQHRVTVKPFHMGKYPVTQAQWQAVARLPQINRELEPDPSRFKGNNRPVETISWYDAEEFCKRLSKATGRNYRLPSEAEWEYACRAGTSTPFHFGQTITPELANYNGTYVYGAGYQGKYRKETTAVGSFKVANAFGLYDMHGNVWEWCADNWHGNYEGAPRDSAAWLGNDNQFAVLRGGSWDVNPRRCRSASRYNNDWAERVFHLNYGGFRVVCAFGRSD
ncbi:MAG: SUMF1/EgtB/PvdO family nonheme iron enzyme [Gloeotrichia echinulata DVL01]